MLNTFDYAHDITSDIYICVFYVLSSVFTCLVFLLLFSRILFHLCNTVRMSHWN